jgi:hypothetical protein
VWAAGTVLLHEGRSENVEVSQRWERIACQFW